MKRYKLLKDTPTLKADTIFVEEGSSDDYKELVQVVTAGCLTRPWFALNEINNFDDWFEEIPEGKRWRAEYGDPYYHINSFGGIQDSYDHREGKDDYRYNTGIYGRTKEELEAKLKYDIARQTLLDDAEGGKWSKDFSNYYVFYNGTEFDITSSSFYRPGTIYFQNKEVFQKSLEQHEEQWEIVRKYEMREM